MLNQVLNIFEFDYRVFECKIFPIKLQYLKIDRGEYFRKQESQLYEIGKKQN